VNARDYAAALIDSALAELDAERSRINDLNVYPVPDGDTGTNLFLTVRAIREELEHSSGSELSVVAAAVTKGSLMGARGNSGVILSQIVRGVCNECHADAHLDTAGLKRALGEGTTAAYRAVKQPVEGTMLTVIREMASAAERLPDDAPLQDALTAVLASGRIAVEHTTRQLAALRQAGVVDAGGYGLLVIYRGIIEALLRSNGHSREAGVLREEAVAAENFAAAALDEPSELSVYRYCTSFLVQGDALPRQRLEELITPLGDSLLMVGDERMLKVHVHTDDPGVVLSHATAYGAISEVEINDMHKQTRERDERLAAAASRTTGTAVVAVVAGEGNKRLFRDLGCAAIVDGGQSMNPSAAQLLEAVEQLETSDVIVLPNNGNVVLTAEQAAGMSARNIVVVPSTSMPAGLAAMIEFDPDADAVTNGRTMERAVKANHSAEITVAVRDSCIGDVEVHKDAVIGLVDGDLVVTGGSLLEAFEGVVSRLAEHRPEFVTVLTSLNGAAPSATDLRAVAVRLCPDAEITVEEGGQPLYPILIGAE
jgi:DAK2 domain fusion protein YloV